MPFMEFNKGFDVIVVGGAHARGRERGLGARMTAADHDNVETFAEFHKTAH